MNSLRVLLAFGLVAVVPARAVYAPLPEQELQKDWTVTLRAGVMYDSNIFGADEGAISSFVYQAAPTLAYSGSLDDQTFAQFAYGLVIDHFVDRPGDKTLDSHNLTARLAHAFSSSTNIDLSDTYQIAKNPESLLAGLPVNTDQSFKRNELNGRLVASPLPKLGATVKARSVNFNYDNATLGRNLDRTENLYGVAGSYDVVPELKAVAEYRHEDINYRTGGSTKDKQTDFLMGGFDYAVARKLAITGRLGAQWRSRSAETDTTSPYAEFSAKYDYAKRSFLSAGYMHTFEETSNVATFTDTRVNRLFVNVQHAVSALVVASASITYEPSQLQGRRGTSDFDETTTRVGLGLTWLPTAHWAFSASYDHDQIESDVPGRGQDRDRVGVSASYAF
ncbi:outer membrane beta-barrel protein [Opitutus terrae]|uniref:Uncharacterized protein n=1 Tax=Opitutus terrae (strain DSM 11246 / JCM 15787 / PB90-1) TaxID=452637 RepID=B1ZMW0_OPITP|nr:outer membrane beta-barrel protein [Opitutus terrae]ACB75388.1 hypothetical protein Oter_2105 [Opitutus terrae PB90-1]